MSEDLATISEQDRPARILIVDDVADNRTILGRRFQRRGYEIAEADSGKGALEMIGREEFDVVLLDVMMPDMNGLEVLRRIREKHTDVQLPVIMVTGKTESSDIVEALTAGANDYITKPVDFAVALARVSTQVRSRQAEEHVRRANEALSRANEDLERRIAERTEQLRIALAEAQAANKSKDEFLVIVSHELRTPLNGMIGMGQMLARTELNEQQRKMVGIVNASADQLHSVVADLLDTLDLTAGGLKLTPQQAPLGALVEEEAAVAAEKAKAKGLAFKVDVAKDAAGARRGRPAASAPGAGQGARQRREVHRSGGGGAPRRPLRRRRGLRGARHRRRLRRRDRQAHVQTLRAGRRLADPKVRGRGPGPGDLQRPRRPDGGPDQRRRRARQGRHLPRRAPADREGRSGVGGRREAPGDPRPGSSSRPPQQACAGGRPALKIRHGASG
ncbi:response regulator [Phenylobacterium sp. J367]|nr:response regulator [Phenylobacterium sp. J367]MCR5878609.1 response regulator [Phenylobacterium sp. J367]